MFEDLPKLRSLLIGIVVVAGVASTAGVAIMSNGIPFLSTPHDSTPPASLAGAATLRPTFVWANAYSLDSTFNSEPLPVGALVEVFDPDGTLAGRAIVNQSGRYGLVAIYADDPATDVDEGVAKGDRLTFTVDGRVARTVGPDEPIWDEEFQLLNVDLQVGY